MALLRRVLGETLRSRRLRQRRTLREVSGAARVSLGYLSEIERGQKEASSELLAAICAALGVRLSDLLREVSDSLVRSEAPVRRIPAPARRELAGVGPRRSGPMPRLPAPRDGVPEDLDQPWEGEPWESAPAEVPAAAPESTERPLEPVGGEPAMFDRPQAVTSPFPVEPTPFTVEGVGELPCPELDDPGTSIFDGQVVALPARCSVVAAA